MWSAQCSLFLVMIQFLDPLPCVLPTTFFSSVTLQRQFRTSRYFMSGRYAVGSCELYSLPCNCQSRGINPASCSSEEVRSLLELWGGSASRRHHCDRGAWRHQSSLHCQDSEDVEGSAPYHLEEWLWRHIVTTIIAIVFLPIIVSMHFYLYRSINDTSILIYNTVITSTVSLSKMSSFCSKHRQEFAIESLGNAMFYGCYATYKSRSQPDWKHHAQAQLWLSITSVWKPISRHSEFCLSLALIDFVSRQLDCL